MLSLILYTTFVGIFIFIMVVVNISVFEHIFREHNVYKIVYSSRYFIHYYFHNA